METRILGKTGLRVSRLGIGLAEIGALALDESGEAQAGQVLNAALDAGITFLDTAACYGNSEELIGRTIAHRRQEYVLATKCGHVTGGYEGEEWTAKTIRDSIDRSLRRMRTDHIDLLQLHSCGVDVLKRGEVIQAVLDAKKAGKARFVGYSGDNEAAQWAVESDLFDTLQTSFNLVDQQARIRLFPLARAKGMGIIAKRPIANAAWGAPQSPSAYADDYFERARQMASAGPIPAAGNNRILLAIGFVLAHDVDTAIIGARRLEHVQENIRLVETLLPLPAEAIEELHRRFDQIGRDWPQLT